MKTWTEFVVWYHENFCDKDKTFTDEDRMNLKFMYDKIYSEGYFDGYEQRAIDDEEDESWFGANSNWS